MSRNYKSRHKLQGNKQRKRKGGCSCLVILLALIIVVGGIVFGYMYQNFNQTVETIQQSRPEEQITLRDESIEISQVQDSFSILLLGIDAEGEVSSEQGRSDILVFVTVNPTKGKMTLTSIPRDTMTEIIGLGRQDKINHAYAFGGVSMAANTVQNLLEVPVDYTISANMQGFSDIIDAIGGLKINPIDTFEQDGYQFVTGQEIQMNGNMALAYTRNRYDTGGDYSRQARARQLVDAVIGKAASFDSIWRLPSILRALEGNVLTDLSLQEIQHIATNYRNVIHSVETLQLEGDGEMIEGIYYEIIDNESLNSVRATLQQEMSIE